MSATQDYHVRINKISIDPDRFARQHPVVWFDTIIHRNMMFDCVHLKDIQTLYDHGYAVGDLVRLRMAGSFPILGPIIAKSTENDRRSMFEIVSYCYSCQKPLIERNGQWYCNGVNCSRTLLARLLYSTHVLNLGYSRDDLNYLIYYQELVQNLPSLLFLSEDDLIGPYYERDEAVSLIEWSQARISDMLNPYDSETRLLTQSQIMDALSIVGLFKSDQKKLIEPLSRGFWTWNNLPDILTSANDLYRFGIERSDAFIIAHHAADRVEELDSLAREF